MTDQERRSARSFLPVWAQWAAAAFLAASAVTALTLMFFAGLHSWRPSQRVAQGPSLAIERAILPSAAGRSADDTRVLAR